MKKNIIANFIGRFWGIISNFLFIPLYIKYLGIESYSIISFTLILTGLLAVLDSGLTATLSREFASRSNDSKGRVRIFNTLETCYYIIVIFATVLLFFFSDLIADKWLNLNSISKENVSYYLRIICFGVGFQFLAGFYTGGLLGLEHQVKANMYQIGWGIIRNGIVVIVLLFKPTLEVFFLWQTGTTFIYVILLRLSLIKTMGNTHSFFIKPKIEKEILLKIWKFAGGMLLISLVAGLNTQLDKLAISNLLSIESLGYYTLAVTLSLGLVTITNPISTAILPRLTKLYTENRLEEAELLFYKLFRFVSIIVFSLTIVITLNANTILWIWTGDMNLVKNVSNLVPTIAFSWAMVSLQVLFFSVAIANAYTKLNNFIGLLSLFITLPGYWLITKHFGVLGTAITFCLVQTTISIIYIYLINKKFLKQIGTLELFFNQLLRPAFIIGIIGYLFSIIPIYSENRILLLFWIGGGTILIIISSIIILIPKKLIFELFNGLNFRK